MNLFVTSNCPTESAKALDDLRLNKMLLETCQLLSTALHLNGYKGPYAITHQNHPITVWVASNYKNYLWTLEHFIALYNERKQRTGKEHKCWEHYYELMTNRFKIPKHREERDPFVNCTPFKDVNNVIKAYRMTLEYKWDNDLKIPTWTNSSPPIWSKRKKLIDIFNETSYNTHEV